MLGLCLFLVGAGAWMYVPNSTGFSINGGTSVNSILTVSSSSTISLSGAGTLNVPAAVYLGAPGTTTNFAIARFNGTTGANVSNSSVLIDNGASITGVQQLTANSIIDTTTMTVGSDVTFSGSILNAPNLPQTGAVDFAGFDGSNNLVGLSPADASTLLGVSDYRIKKNITALTGTAATVIGALVPVSFQFTGTSLAGKANGYDATKTRIGFIAQSVSATIANSGAQTPDGTNSYDRDAVIAWLVLYAQQQEARIKVLELAKP